MDEKLLAAKIAEAVQGRLGRRDAAVTDLIAQEVAAALNPDPTVGSSALSDPAMVASVDGPTTLTERVVVSANGRNAPGIAARLTEVIGDFGGDIRDINQTIVGPYFTIIIVVDIAHPVKTGARFGDFKAKLTQAGEQAGIHVVTLHDDLLSAMHNV